MHKIQIGTWLEWIIDLFTLGWGQRLSEWIAIDLLGYKSCGCCQRKEWLNRLTNKSYDGQCNGIKF